MFLTCFSCFSCYFLILVFLHNCYLLIYCYEVIRRTCAPKIEAHHAWFLGVRQFPPFLPKVSRANVRWENANHTFFTHKNHWTDTFLHDISPAELRSTARVWNPLGISNL
jgi:hypothetical protein